MKKALIISLIATTLLGTLAGCSGEKTTDNETKTLRVFTNLPDRNNGQGLIEQKIIDDYMAENPNIIIEVEALDEEAYKTKFRAYAMDGLPDVVSVWGQPSFIDEIIEAELLAELNEEDYTDYGFISGSLEGFKDNGKLYGLPRNTDIILFYYNAKMFEDNGWQVPNTYDELLELSDKINDTGITPVSINGGNGWILQIYLTDILFKLIGKDYSDFITNAVDTGDFSDPKFKEAVTILKETANAGLFQNGFDSQDYSTAMNLFTNGKAAMFYMGSWEASMALNKDIPQEIRENIRAFTMPLIDGGVTSKTDISAWNGGGYSVAADSKNKELAIDFLNYMYQPDKLSKYGWENGVGLSAQDQSKFITGTETELQLQVLDLINTATSVSGNPINDRGSSAFKSVSENEIQSVSNGAISIDQFLTALGEGAK